jgi:molybdopterin synthase sulfur carrier subunit
MRILYFASVKAKLGLASEDVSPPTSVATLAQLVDWLKTQSPKHAEALADMRTLRAAVNHEHTGFDTAIKAGDEIAFFPPVTGG